MKPLRLETRRVRGQLVVVGRYHAMKTFSHAPRMPILAPRAAYRRGLGSQTASAMVAMLASLKRLYWALCRVDGWLGGGAGR